MVRVLITRPADDAAPLINWVGAHGHEAVTVPLLQMRFFATAPAGLAAQLAACRAVLVTSANGIRALARLTTRRDVPVFAVGPGSAAQARQLGYAQVESAGGDVAALAGLVRAHLPAGPAPLLHPAGTERAGDLAALLGADGYFVQRAVLYEAETARSLPDAVVSDLCTKGFGVATFFSPRTAATFVRLAKMHDLDAICVQAGAVVLSAAVAEVLAGLSWRFVQVAAQPDQTALLHTLAACLKIPTATTQDGRLQ